jgi:hypothetical protein
MLQLPVDSFEHHGRNHLFFGRLSIAYSGMGEAVETWTPAWTACTPDLQSRSAGMSHPTDATTEPLEPLSLLNNNNSREP